MSAQAIGIDFGTTKTLVAYLNPRANLPETLRLGRGTDFVPTTAAHNAGGQLFFGNEAEDMLEDPSVAYLRGFKMELGSETPLRMLAQADGSVKPVTAQQLATEFLRSLRLAVQEKAFMGGEVSEAVITRPGPFSPARCQALEEAALAAGFTKVTLTTEPEAAGLAFCRLNTAEAFKDHALVIDWGGGTLDIALVSRQGDRVVRHSELADGDMNIGGERFDERLWKHAEAQLGGVRLKPAAQMPRVRKAKEQLSSRNSVTLRLRAEDGICPPLELTREHFESLIAADVDKAAAMVQALLARIPAEMKPEMLLLVGGSSAIPLIREKLEAATGLPARSWQYSREAVALGAALMTGDGKNGTYAQAKLDKALSESAAKDDTQAALDLLGRGSDALPTNGDGQTPLSQPKDQARNTAAAELLAHCSRDQARERLAERGIAREKYQKVLFRAGAEGDTELIRLLSVAGADVNATDENGKSPLCLAAERGRTDAARLLLEIGADVSAALRGGWSELHLATSAGLTDRVRKLLAEGGDVNAKDEHGYAPLHWAACNGHLDVVCLLLESRADVNAKDKKDETPLYRAASKGHSDILRLLLEAGSDVNAACMFGGSTLLHRAAENGHTDVVRLLLANGADPNAKDKDGNTPLHRAAEYGHEDIVHQLIAVGADVNAPEGGFLREGYTLLHRAALSGNAHAVRLLLEAGADVNAKKGGFLWEGYTPLHMAVQSGSVAVTRLLLEAGADVNGISRRAGTPLDLAIQCGRSECIGLLRMFGGKRSRSSNFDRLMGCLLWVLLSGTIMFAIIMNC